MRLAVIGCGRLGSAVATRLQADGWRVVGLRRAGDENAGFPLLTGNGADHFALTAVADALGGEPDGVLLSAAPGLRAGGDNGLERVAAAIAMTWPRAACLQTSSTAVCADAAGHEVDECSPLATGERVDALLRIEAAVRGMSRHLVLRLGGLVGPGRRTIQQRLAADPCVLRGDPARPFSYCHEDDARDVICALLPRLQAGERLPSVCNCVAPQVLSYRAYALALAAEMGLPEPRIESDGSDQPRRRVVARRLWADLPAFRWRDAFGRQID